MKLPRCFMVFTTFYCSLMISGEDNGPSHTTINHYYQQPSPIITPARVAFGAGIVIGSYALYKYFDFYTPAQAQKDGQQVRTEMNKKTTETVAVLNEKKAATTHKIDQFTRFIKAANERYLHEISTEIGSNNDQLKILEDDLKSISENSSDNQLPSMLKKTEEVKQTLIEDQDKKDNKSKEIIKTCTKDIKEFQMLLNTK